MTRPAAHARERHAELTGLSLETLEDLLRSKRGDVSIRDWLRIDAVAALVAAAERSEGAKGEVVAKILDVERVVAELELKG